MAYIGQSPSVGNFQVCDAISVVNGQAAYTMQVSSVNVVPETANHMIVSLNGVIQAPGSSYTVSGSTITFASNLATGDVINFIHILGSVLDLGVPSDDTVTAAKISSNAVTAAKFNADVISGQTALASAPADTDEFLVSDAGVLKRIDYSLIKGGGKVLQVLSMTDNTEQTISSSTNTFNDSALTLAITPSASSSKILIFYSMSNAQMTTSGYVHSTIKQAISGGSDVNLGGTYGFAVNGTDNGSSHIGNHGVQYLDSPSTTNAITYTIQTRSSGSSQSYRRFRDSTTGSLTLIEIGA